MNARIVVVLSIAMAAPLVASAGWGDFVKDKAEQAAKRQAGRAVDESANEAYEEGKKGITGDGEPARAEKAPKAGKPRTADSAAEAVAADDEKVPPAKGKGKGEAAPPAQEEVAAGEVFSPKFDFVPGDKVLVFDDFAETDVGEYPARWTIKDGGGNPVEVVSYKGRKWLKSIPGDGGYSHGTTQWLRYDSKGDLPKKFTVELDADLGSTFGVLFDDHSVKLSSSGHVQTQNVSAEMKRQGPVVKRVSISVNGTYVKVYVGGERVLQDPDGVVRPLKRVGLWFWGSNKDDGLGEHQMITAFRLAEGGKDVTQALNAEGRIVVHGIYFDTGSDLIKPESGGALRTILKLLNDEKSLLFVIEGHTDDQGGSAVNGPLSEKRASAVKSWLVSQGIDAKRLGVRGMGATKPIDKNDTQEGRAMNRRVEFVKVDKVASGS